jgi:hypothetical protein
LCRTLMVSPVKTIQETFEKIRRKYPHPPRVAIMPKANSTYIKVQTN